MAIDDMLKERIIIQSKLVIPESLQQGEWCVALRKHDEATAQLLGKDDLPVARVICELRGTFGSKVAVPTSYTLYEENNLPDGKVETVHSTYRIMGKTHSFFIGGYFIKDQDGKRVAQGTIDKEGNRFPLDFV